MESVGQIIAFDRWGYLSFNALVEGEPVNLRLRNVA